MTLYHPIKWQGFALVLYKGIYVKFLSLDNDYHEVIPVSVITNQIYRITSTSRHK